MTLRDEDFHVRMSAALALGKIGPAAEKAVPALVQALTDEGRIRVKAASALMKVSPDHPKALPVILAALGDKKSDVRTSAALALTELDQLPDQLVPQLTKGLGDRDDYGVRQHCAISLGKIGPTAAESVPALLGLLADWHTQVNCASALALWRIRHAAMVDRLLPTLIKELKRGAWGKYPAGVLTEIGPAARSAIPDVREALGHRKPQVRYYAAVALMGIDRGTGIKEALPALVALLKDTRPDNRTRALAAQSLGEIGAGIPGAKTALSQALDDRDSYVRKMASEALKRVQGTD
jgi:HEAT repeat protein